MSQDQKISQLTSAATLTGPEHIPLVQSGNTRKSTVASLLSSSLFTQTGTGATARSITSKLGDIISVKDFGATGDGVTDDTAAFQALINSAALAGYVPAGTYKLASTLSLKANFMLYGDGANASILNYTGNGVAVQAVGASDNWRSVIRDLKITTSTGTHSLRLKDLAEFTVERCYIRGGSVAGLHLTATPVTGMCLFLRVFGCSIMENTGDGILTDTANLIHQVSIHANRIDGNAGMGLNLTAAGFGWSIVGNSFEGNGGATEIDIAGGSFSGFDFSGNYIESSAAKSGGSLRIANTQAQDGIDIHGNFFIADVAITNAITLGVSAFVTGVSVKGNVFDGSYTNAINANAVIGGDLGPNKMVGSIVHVANVGASATGLKIFNPNQRKVVTYSASMTIDTTTGEEFDITATNGNAFTINAPTNPWDGAVIVVTLRNGSGGALGAATWNVVFKMSAWTNPANTFNRSITFKFNATNWVQISQTGVDIPN